MRHSKLQIYALCIGMAGASVVPAAGQTIEQSQRTAGRNAILLDKQAQHPQAPIESLAGRAGTYIVQKGDSLFQIARSHNVAASALARMNRLKGGRLKPGRRLVLPTLYIVPRNPGSGIVLNLPERALYLFKKGVLQARYPVAVGKSDWQTALGDFKVEDKVVNPPWKPTREMVARTGIRDEVVPPGPENPIGDRWMGWSEPGFGFHSTNAPRSIGRVTSHGCVRLYPEAAHRLFDQIAVGTPIFSIYEPVVIGEQDGAFYLSVYPDIYHTGWTSLAHIRKMLDRAGLLPVVDPVALRQVVATQDGSPRRIVGVGERLSVNGAAITGPIRPTRVAGRWIVPAREVVKALGGEMSTEAGGTVRIAGNGHTLVLQSGRRPATLDEKPIDLSTRPSVVRNTLMAPLYPLVQMFGVKVAEAKGKEMSLTTAPAVAAQLHTPPTSQTAAGESPRPAPAAPSAGGRR